MDLVTFFLRQHAAVHASDVSGHVFPIQRIFDGLNDDQMRMRPGPASTPWSGCSGTWRGPKTPR
jgi:hypothetical protein